MNGHGKTSFLLALYLGLFGRFGLRHAEGFASDTGEDSVFYRKAISQFRRSTASPDDPTTVELVFSPTDADGKDGVEVKLVRSWFFTAAGTPRQGDSFETVDLYIDGKPQKLHSGLEAAHDRLERYLFPANFMPAFFFDGEQAQTLINNSGETGIKKSVEVLFGTKLLDETFDAIKIYLQGAHSKLGGKRNTSTQQRQIDEKIADRTALETELSKLQKDFKAAELSRSNLEAEQRKVTEALARLGGERKSGVEQAHSDVERAAKEKADGERALTATVKELGLTLAISRLSQAITNRLVAEESRERWESLRDGTMFKTEEVLRSAMPEPPETDPLLGNLSEGIRQKVKDRFRRAVEQIYEPPPNNCASEYILGHVRGELRSRVVSLLEETQSHGAHEIRSRARKLKEARERLEDANARRDRIGNLPTEVKQLSDRLAEVGTQIADVSRTLGQLENQIKKRKSDQQDLSAEIGRLQDTLAKMGPEQQRIAIAEKVRTVLEGVSEQLKPITLARLEELVTKHFIAIADKRFKSGRVEFPDGGPPRLKRDGHPDTLIEMMSGFERRSFGIAFSLALAEITKRRIPLVIDTPLGNADKEYRKRLLDAVTDVDLDQIIILTHDAEVAGELFEKIESQVKQTFLVEFDAKKQESLVFSDAYFDGVGR
jgi:DNA sulfur modification protein DndD